MARSSREHFPQIAEGADDFCPVHLVAHARARQRQASDRTEAQLPVRLDLLQRLAREPAGAEHQNVAQVVPAAAQRLQDFLEEEAHRADAHERQRGEDEQRAARVAVLAGEVGDRDQEQAGEDGGLEDPEHLVERRFVPLRTIETHAAQHQRPEHQREGAHRERLARRGQLRVRKRSWRPESDGVGAGERGGDHRHVQEDPEGGENLMVPLEHRARKYRERTGRASYRPPSPYRWNVRRVPERGARANR